MTELTENVLCHALADAPETALRVMRLSLVDWIAVGLAGQAEPVARITGAMVRDEGGQEIASLFGGGRAPARGAALVNGATSHALDYDDTHFAHIGHPSVAVLPAALAAAEYREAGREQMLRAALAGCEASVRFGLAFGRGHYQAGFHQTATAGAFGAAVAAARLISDDPAVTRQALAIVSTRASGLKSQFGTMGKPYNAGIAAANGVEAAMLAARGFLSSDMAVDGAQGFVVTHHCDGMASAQDGFLMEEVSHKFHACCHGLHATLEAIKGLEPIDPAAVSRVEITTHPRWMSVCNKPAPQTGLEAKFSYRAVTALSLLGYDTARLNTFRDDLCADAQVVALRDKVEVRADDTLPETASKVELHAGSGVQRATYDLARPMAYGDRADRVRGKAAALLGQDTADRLWAAVHGPENGLDALTGVMGCGPLNSD